MRLLLDTHVILWAAQGAKQLLAATRELIADPANELSFSVVSLWEIVIERGLGRENFRIDPHALRRGLLDNGYQELPVHSRHVLMVGNLPLLHKDPFDRLLIAQAMIEGMTLLTADAQLAQYPDPVQCM